MCLAIAVLPSASDTSWNSRIIGLVRWGEARQALALYHKAQALSLHLSSFTYMALLKACTNLRDLETGHGIHDCLQEEGLLEANHFVGTALIDMYAKCGMMMKAQEVFDRLAVHDVVSWTALIAGYAQHDFSGEALHCFEQMQIQGVHPNAMTYACALKACGSFAAVDKGCEIHVVVETKGLLKSNLVVGTSLVDMYGKFGMMEKAQEVFDMLAFQNLVSWNALVAGYVQHELGQSAMDCFEQMQAQGISPDGITFACMFKACASVGESRKGRTNHARIELNKMPRIDQVLGIALVDMYAKFGMLSRAKEIFDELPTNDDVVAWTALIAGYVEHKHDEEALELFQQMRCKGLSPNAVTYACTLKSCGSIGAMERGQELHANILQTESLKTNQIVGNALVDMYAKCGLLSKAHGVFDELPVRNIVSWNALITAYAQIGKLKNAVRVLQMMQEKGLHPDLVTFISILNACSHAGLVDTGQAFFIFMNRYYGICPTLDHHSCLVNLLARAGQLDTAAEFVSKTPSSLNIVAWLTLLGACNIWGDVELGRLAFKQTMQLDEKETAAYVCFSNIYAGADL